MAVFLKFQISISLFVLFEKANDIFDYFSIIFLTILSEENIPLPHKPYKNIQNMLKKILQTPLPKNLLPTLKHQISKQQPSPRLVLPIAKRQSFMTTFPFCTNNDKKGNN